MDHINDARRNAGFKAIGVYPTNSYHCGISMRLQNKVGVVTGGGRGIGKAIALALAHEGAHLVVRAVTTSENEGVAAEFTFSGTTGLAVQVDLSHREAIQNFVQKIFSHFLFNRGHLDQQRRHLRGAKSRYDHRV